jgi:translation initiation factor IF-2
MTESHATKRAPVVAIMGHIDHGKSTLLAYIRKSSKPLSEAGGITQHISAYEVEHKTPEGTIEKITFLDTPGHAAFSGHRNRGAQTADIAILVVSAEDGVKPQTVEALKSITESKVPYVIAITKIDKADANIDRTKQSLAENNMYVEGYGGNISFVPVSGKSGAGVSELLDLVLLTASLEDLTGDPTALAEGIIIESGLDMRKGIGAVCIIKNGSMEKGMFVACAGAVAPVRVIEDWTGKPIQRATFSSPVKIIGWNNLPQVGSIVHTFKTKDEAEEYARKVGSQKSIATSKDTRDENVKQFPVIIKTDTGGSLEAVTAQIQKLSTETITPYIIYSGIGTVSEGDVRMAEGSIKACIVGFNVKVDAQAKTLAERDSVEIVNFDIIYKLSEWLTEKLIENKPVIEVEEISGVAKVLKNFSKVKDKQIIGCRVETGRIALGEHIKIFRREAEIGTGKIREMQSQKQKISEVEEGKEFGCMVEAKIEIAPGDRLQAVMLIRK